MSVPGRAEKIRSLTLVLEGNNPRFPWEPSATMLTYRLTGTTEVIGVRPERTLTIVHLGVACDQTTRQAALPSVDRPRVTVTLPG
jgi:hypothetical protein